MIKNDEWRGSLDYMVREGCSEEVINNRTETQVITQNQIYEDLGKEILGRVNKQ